MSQPQYVRHGAWRSLLESVPIIAGLLITVIPAAGCDLDDLVPDGLRHYWKPQFVADLPARAVETYVGEGAGRMPQRISRSARGSMALMRRARPGRTRVPMSTSHPTTPALRSLTTVHMRRGWSMRSDVTTPTTCSA